ncbi:MAG TPA: hypothetical protein VNZ54_06290, partial [bacterium]|nr:hypothetical protein [bacterium]
MRLSHVFLLVLLVLALTPGMARAEAGEYGGTEVMNQAMAQPATDATTVTAAPASVSPKTEVYDADEVVVTGRSANLLGQADSASQGRVSADDLNRRPLLRPAEVLE